MTDVTTQLRSATVGWHPRGDCLRVGFPDETLQALGLELGQQVRVHQEDGYIKVTPSGKLPGMATLSKTRDAGAVISIMSASDLVRGFKLPRHFKGHTVTASVITQANGNKLLAVSVEDVMEHAKPPVNRPTRAERAAGFKPDWANDPDLVDDDDVFDIEDLPPPPPPVAPAPAVPDEVLVMIGDDHTLLLPRSKVDLAVRALRALGAASFG